MKVAYQGEPGAYSEGALLQVFPDAEPMPCETVRLVFSRVTSEEAAFGVVPLENSQAGSVNQTYDLLLHTSLVSMVGEVVVPVDHALLGLPGARLEDIKRVYSHPQALAQSEEFLASMRVEVVPVHDTAYFWAYAEFNDNRTRIIGPNCPGIASPGKSNAGIIPADITSPGRIGLVSKSGTLTYQMMYELRDIGFSTCVGIGGDPIIGTTHIDALRAFQEDPDTDAVVMIGEIGGDAEERAAAYIEQHVTKPVVGYVAGFTAPEGKTMGHAGAIVSGSAGTAQAKKEALEKVGVRVGKTPSETAVLMREIMKNR